jgi:hypothetical protein
MITLNQDIEILKNFALKHKGINTFYFGDEWEVGASNPIVYPLMNAILQSSVSVKGVISRKYLIVISDLVNKDESNENQVLSDTEQICYDLPMYLRSVANSGLLSTFKVVEDISLTDFTERNDDEVSGHFFEITLSSHIGNASCNLPIAAGGILDGNYIYLGGSTASTSCLPVVIYDQEGNILQTFTNGGTYIVTVLDGLQQIIGATPTIIIQQI